MKFCKIHNLFTRGGNPYATMKSHSLLSQAKDRAYPVLRTVRSPRGGEPSFRHLGVAEITGRYVTLCGDRFFVFA